MPIADAVATLNTPETKPAIDRIIVSDVQINRPSTTARIVVDYVDTTDSTRKQDAIVLSAPADVIEFITAIGTARPGETGTAARRFNFRVLGFLVDTGRLPGVTLSA